MRIILCLLLYFFIGSLNAQTQKNITRSYSRIIDQIRDLTNTAEAISNRNSEWLNLKNLLMEVDESSFLYSNSIHSQGKKELSKAHFRGYIDSVNQLIALRRNGSLSISAYAQVKLFHVVALSITKQLDLLSFLCNAVYQTSDEEWLKFFNQQTPSRNILLNIRPPFMDLEQFNGGVPNYITKMRELVNATKDLTLRIRTHSSRINARSLIQAELDRSRSILYVHGVLDTLRDIFTTHNISQILNSNILLQPLLQALDLSLETLLQNYMGAFSSSHESNLVAVNYPVRRGEIRAWCRALNDESLFIKESSRIIDPAINSLRSNPQLHVQRLTELKAALEAYSNSQLVITDSSILRQNLLTSIENATLALNSFIEKVPDETESDRSWDFEIFTKEIIEPLFKKELGNKITMCLIPNNLPVNASGFKKCVGKIKTPKKRLKIAKTLKKLAQLVQEVLE